MILTHAIAHSEGLAGARKRKLVQWSGNCGHDDQTGVQGPATRQE